MKMEQPTHCVLRKVFWGILLGVGVLMFIICLAWQIKDNSSNGNDSVFPIIGVMLGFCAIAVACGIIPWAFEPELDKMRKKRELYKKQQGRELEAEYYAEDANIHSMAIKKRTRAVKEGLKEERCANCGDLIESNEKYCSKCGKQTSLKCPKCKTKNMSTDKYCRNCGEKLGE